MFKVQHKMEDVAMALKKKSHLYFKVIVIQELLVHCLSVRVDGPQENSDRQEKRRHTHEQSTQRGSVLSKNKY